MPENKNNAKGITTVLHNNIPGDEQNHVEYSSWLGPSVVRHSCCQPMPSLISHLSSVIKASWQFFYESFCADS